MLSKSLIQFSLDGQGCVPSLLFDLRPNYGGGNEDNGDLLKRSHARMAALSASDPVTGHLWPTPPRETPGHSWASLDQSLVGSLLLYPGSWCIQGFVCTLQESDWVMLKIHQARLQQYMNHALPDVQAGFRKNRGTKIKLPISAESSKKQESSRKTSLSALLTMSKPLTVWITINCGKFWKRWEYQTAWPASWEICMEARKQQLELDMEQQTGSK